MERIKIDTMLKFKFPSTLKKNKTGDKIGFMMHQMNQEENKYDSNLWILDTKTNQLKPLQQMVKRGISIGKTMKQSCSHPSETKMRKKTSPLPQSYSESTSTVG